jgi:hypothetical protein
MPHIGVVRRAKILQSPTNKIDSNILLVLLTLRTQKKPPSIATEGLYSFEGLLDNLHDSLFIGGISQLPVYREYLFRQ